MIKAKIKTTGQKIVKILIRPYSHEFYDFVRCNEDGSIQGTLLRRDELEIIGDKQEEIIENACTWLLNNMSKYIETRQLNKLTIEIAINNEDAVNDFRRAIGG